ncbi:MAG: hypothetical protein HBSAPP02_29470 [Phycisphaerae bacterium]|nr:MAG: hypothetical protein HRU71_01855 [Planctomycetia bacterium]RIK66043.1 MAG: hypothetical protein DCC66_13780 [Planctomycetota bacterium]GJQ27915.1 MAG: hypothetical protein HBSAPP02_29470 [Phycisphaerae bacterium]
MPIAPILFRTLLPRLGPVLVIVGLAGCAEPGPRLLDVTDSATAPAPRALDTNRDGCADYWQQFDTTGRIVSLAFDTNADGSPDECVDRSAPNAGDRHLVILLDSIPFGLVEEAWKAGRFRLFHPPGRVISPFPVMTDLSFSELFGVSPSPGVEASYYDGRRLRDGYEVYAHGGNAGWNAQVDYALRPIVHAVAYLNPRKWYDHELGKIQRMFLGGRGDFRGYVVTTSGLGAWYGRAGHAPALEKLDAACEYILHACRGRVQITLLSDHGHVLQKSRRIPLSNLLAEKGWHVGSRLSDERDVVVPEFGVVSCAAIHTRRPADVARDCIGIDGVELAMYRESGRGEITVLGRNGETVLRMDSRGRFGVKLVRGDPLHLAGAVESLRAASRMDAAGYATDADWSQVMGEGQAGAGTYPDPIYRIWRAFNGLVENVPDVYLSLADGYHCGSELMTRLVDISATHGALNAVSSTGFVMTTAGPLPPSVRMRDLAGVLKSLGVPVRKR